MHASDLEGNRVKVGIELLLSITSQADFYLFENKPVFPIKLVNNSLHFTILSSIWVQRLLLPDWWSVDSGRQLLLVGL